MKETEKARTVNTVLSLLQGAIIKAQIIRFECVFLKMMMAHVQIELSQHCIQFHNGLLKTVAENKQALLYADLVTFSQGQGDQK